MNDVSLMEIALEYAEKSYACDQLRYGDDLYHATADEKEDCIEFWCEVKEIGEKAFREKIIKVKNALREFEKTEW